MRLELRPGATGRCPPTGLAGMFPLEARRHQAEACAEQIGQALADIALATREYPSPDPGLVDSEGPTVLTGAYLLRAAAAAGFPTMVQELTSEHSAAC